MPIRSLLLFCLLVAGGVSFSQGVYNIPVIDSPAETRPFEDMNVSFSVNLLEGTTTSSAHIKIFQSTNLISNADELAVDAEPLFETTIGPLTEDPVPVTATIRIDDADVASYGPIQQYLVFVVTDNDINTTDRVYNVQFLLQPIKDAIIQNLVLPITEVAAGSVLESISFEAFFGSSLSIINSYSNFNYQFFLSEDDVLSTGDLMIHSGEKQIQYNVFIPVEIPLLTIPSNIRTGQWHLIAAVNYYQQFTEEDYSNNTVKQTLTITPPMLADLSTSITAPMIDIPAGSPMSISILLQNQGTRPISAAKHKIVLSKNDILDSDDVLLLESLIYSSVEPSGNQSHPLEVNLPEGTDAGSWHLFVIGDSENSVAESDENNNYSSTAIEVVPPLIKDLQVLEVTVQNGTLLTKGDYILGSSKIKNNGTGATLPFSHTLYLSADDKFSSGDVPLGESSIASLNAGAETIANQLYISIPEYITAGNYFLLSVADAKLDVAESNEGNNIFSLPVTVQNRPLPDLKVSESSVVVTPMIGSVGYKFEVSFDVENIGNLAAYSSNVAYFLSENEEFDGDDFRILVTEEASQIPYVMPGEAFSFSNVALNLPRKFTPGSYKLFISIDYVNTLVESNEMNNVYTTDVTVVVPDYVVFSSEAVQPSVAAGTTIEVSSNIKNSSDGAQGVNTYIQYYLSKDEVLDEADVLMMNANYYPAIGYVPELGPTVTSDDILSPPLMVLSSIQPDDYFIIVVADAQNEVSEADENNNTFAVPITITYPDLSLSDMVVQPFNIAAGGSSMVSVAVRNNGDATSVASMIYYYFSEDEIIDETDLFLNTVYVSPVEPGGLSDPYEVQITLPVVEQGPYHILAFIDPANVLAEKNENNNIASFDITITNPDLQVFSIDPTPEVVGLTQPLNLKVYVKNHGNAPAPTSRIAIYLSKNQTIDEFDYAYPVYQYIGPLLASETSDPLEYVLNLPSTISEGAWFIIVSADFGNDILESNENNNIKAQPITISVPDLIVANQFASPSTSSVGALVEVTADIKNSGTVRSPGGNVAYYLSDDEQLSEDDYAFSTTGYFPTLETFTDEAPLAHFITLETNLVLPSYYAAGNYFILIQVDPFNAIAETNELNNIESTPIIITIPDYSIPLAEALNPNVGSGSSFTLRHRVSNESSTADAPISFSGVYLSTDATFSEAADSLIGFVQVPEIANSSTSDLLQVPILIPDTILAGTYSVFVKSDHQNLVTETNETNNVKSFTINVTNPDLTVENLTPSKLDMGAGEFFTINVDVKNIGAVTASPSHMSFYLSKSGSIDDESLFLTMVQVPLIVKETAYSFLDIPVVVPYEIEAGDWFLIAAADDLLNLAETDEANNTQAQAVSIKLPDLEIFNYSTLDTEPGVGGKPTLSLRVRNNGVVSSPVSKVRFFLSDDDEFDQDDILVGDTVVVSIQEGNTTAVIRETITLPYAMDEGTYTVFALVDPDSTLSEISEVNNLSSVTLDIVWPDLQIAGITSSEINIPNGQSLAFEVDVFNGLGGTAPLSSLSLFFSEDEIYDIKDTPVGEYWVDPLMSLTSQYISAYAYVPTTMKSGQWYLIAITDKPKNIPESDEDNNMLAMPFNVVGPDLFVQFENVSPSYLDLDKLKTNDPQWRTILSVASVSNNQFAYAEATTFGVYLSDDEIYDAQDQNLTVRNIPFLSAGQSIDLTSMYLQLSQELEAGNYFILFVADKDNVVEEFDEENNIKAVPFEIRGPKPDLLLEYFSVAPELISAGLGTEVLLSIANRGESASNLHKLNYYLSSDENIGGGDDIFLKSFDIAQLDKNTSVWRNDSIYIPTSVVAGDYNLLVFVDAENVVDEKSEENVTVHPISVRNPLASDLEIKFTSSLPEIIHAGSDLLVSAIVQNNELGKTSPSWLRYYLSSDENISGEDLQLSSVRLPQVSAVDNINAKSEIILPKDLVPNTYNLLLFVDADETVSETLESNNIIVLPLNVMENLKPDLAPFDFSIEGFLAGNTTATMNFFLRNAGQGRAEESYLEFYLSRNATVDSEDLLLASSVVEPMPAHSERIIQRNVLIPDEAGNGYWYVIAKADATEIVVESVEANNTREEFVFVQPSLYPNLMVDFYATSYHSYAGQTISPDVTIYNSGNADVLKTSVKYYLSMDGTFGSNDIELAEYQVDEVYKQGYQHVYPQIIVPQVPAGNYYLIAYVDPSHEILESNEDNNIDVLPLILTSPPKPNLIVSLVEDVTQVGSNSYLNFDSHFENISLGFAGKHVAKYYLSANQSIDASDRYLGTDTLTSLLSGQEKVISKSLFIPANVASGLYYVIAKIDANNEIDETDETNNEDLFQLVVSDALLPDLIVTLSDVPTNTFANGLLTFTQKVENQEVGTAAESVAKLYLSKNQTVDSGDIVLADFVVTSLREYTDSTFTTSVLIPSTVVPGDYYIISVVDQPNAIEELDETNNAFSVFVNVGPAKYPDLRTYDVSLDNLVINAGKTATVNFTVANFSTGASGATDVRFYLSTDDEKNAGDVLLETLDTEILGPESYYLAEADLPIPTNTQVGDYNVLMIIDEQNAVEEDNEINNVTTVALTVAAPIYPDLTVLSITPSVSEINSGLEFGIDVNIKNQGLDISTPTTVKIYLSSDQAVNGSDILLASLALGGLNVGATSIVSGDGVVPQSVASGNYFLVAQIDADNNVNESDELNNTLTLAFTVLEPVFADLVWSDASVSLAEVNAGGSVLVYYNVLNQGLSSAASSTSGIYLSTNNTWESTDLKLADASVPGLTSMENYIGSSSVIIPNTVVPGAYHIIVKADASTEIQEEDELNNEYSFSVVVLDPLYPDFIVQSVTALPASIPAGESSSIFFSMKNIGDVVGGASITHIYLSSDNILDGNDNLLKSIAVQELAVNAVSNSSSTVTVPITTVPGEYFILAAADGNTIIQEKLENNNVTPTAITVLEKLKANLKISSSVGVTPGSVNAGQHAIIDFTVLNNGETSSANTNIKVFLSADLIVDGSDVTLSTETLGALASGGTQNFDIDVVIPVTTPAGGFKILIELDNSGSIEESNETDNLTSVSLTVLQPLPVNLLLSATSLSADEIQAGKFVTVTTTVSNQSPNQSKAFDVKVYLSANQTVDINDALLYTESVSGLASNATVVIEESVLIPEDSPSGSYFIVFEVDGTNAVIESNETDNSSFVSLEVTPVVGIEDILNSGSKVFPNPVRHVMFIEWSSAGQIIREIRVVNQIGQPVYIIHPEETQQNTEVGASAWTSGIYLIQFVGEKAIITKKIVKE